MCPSWITRRPRKTVCLERKAMRTRVFSAASVLAVTGVLTAFLFLFGVNCSQHAVSIANAEDAVHHACDQLDNPSSFDATASFKQKTKAAYIAEEYDASPKLATMTMNSEAKIRGWDYRIVEVWNESEPFTIVEIQTGEKRYRKFGSEERKVRPAENRIPWSYDCEPFEEYEVYHGLRNFREVSTEETDSGVLTRYSAEYEEYPDNRPEPPRLDFWLNQDNDLVRFQRTEKLARQTVGDEGVVVFRGTEINVSVLIITDLSASGEIEAPDTQ